MLFLVLVCLIFAWVVLTGVIRVSGNLVWSVSQSQGQIIFGLNPRIYACRPQARDEMLKQLIPHR